MTGRIWLMACCLIACTATRLGAQWGATIRDSLLRIADPDEASHEQAYIYWNIASTWTLSAKARPYIDHLDSIVTVLAAAESNLDQRPLADFRAAVHSLNAYQAKFRRDVPAALAHFQASCRLIHHFEADARVHDAIAALYLAVGEPGMAISTLREVLEPVDTIDYQPDAQRQTVASLRISLGGAYTAKGDLAEAERWLAKAERDTAIDGVHVMLLEERARLCLARADTLGALRACERALGTCNPPPDHWGMVGPLTAIARLQLARKDHKAALATADSCAAVALHTGDEAGWCGCTILGGQARHALGRAREAERALRMALDTARHYGYLGLARATGDEGSMVRAAELLKDMYLTQGRWREAVEMTSYWSALKDTLNRRDGRVEVLRASMRRQALADSLELVRRAEDERCAMDGELRQEQERRAYYLQGGIAGLLLFALIAFLLLDRLRRTRRMAAQERTIAELRVRDEIRRDVHDDLGAGLSALKLRSELALRDANDGDLRERFRALSGKADELMGTMRDLLWSLDAEHRSLAGTIDHCMLYARGYLAEHGIALEHEVHGTPPATDPGPRERRGLLLVVKEALHNVVKHAHADRVRMTWTFGPEAVLTIHDNGRGMDGSPLPDEGLGLGNIHTRMQRMGGTVAFVNEGGLRVECRWPVAGA